MSEVRKLIGCFFKYKRLYEETKRLIYLVYMENVARAVGSSFYAWWRRMAPDYAEWWGTCDVEVNSCEEAIRVAVACWPNVEKNMLRRCMGKEINYLISGRYVC
jgi:hypothetical protein